MKTGSIRNILLILVANLLVFSIPFSSAEAPKRGGTLTYGIQSEPRLLDPHLVITDGAVGHVVSNIYNTLVRYDENMGIVPDLAEKWDILSEGREMVFHLRRNVTFHDGTPCDAEAIKFSFERILDPKNNSPYGKFFALIDRIDVVDAHSVRFIFKKPWPGFFYQVLYVGGMGIVSPTAMKKLGNEGFGRQPVGTGPFKISEWVKDDHITLVKNDKYFRQGFPYLDKILFKIIPDVNVLLANLRTGKVDLVRDFEAQLMPLVERDPNIKVSIKMAYTFDWWALNSKQPPFDDKRIRHAVNLGIDRAAIAKVVYGPHAQAATSQISPANRYHHPSTLPTFRYDPERAKKLLKEAGAENLEFTLISYTVKPQLAQIATVIQEQLGKIGVKVKHEVLEHQAWLSNVLKSRNFQASVVPGTGGPEPNSYVMFWTSDNPINFVGMNNPELNKLVPVGQVTLDEKKRKEIYYKIQELGADEAMWMALIYVPTFAAMSKKVQDYVHLPYNVSYMDSVWLEK